MIDRKFIGMESRRRGSLDVEKGRLRLFAKATGEKNPIYFDEAAAKAAGYPALPVPPTFAVLPRQPRAADDSARLRDMGVPHRQDPARRAAVHLSQADLCRRSRSR